MHGRHRTPKTASAPGAQSRTRWTLLLLLSVAQLMVILDISAVNVALPDLAKDLDIDVVTIGADEAVADVALSAFVSERRLRKTYN